MQLILVKKIWLRFIIAMLVMAVFLADFSFLPFSRIGEARAQGCLVSEDGLVSYWPFDEVLGNTVADLVDGNVGMLVNGPVFVEDGKVNGALSFDGVDDEVKVLPSINLDITGDVTLELWAKRELVDVRQIIIDKGAGFLDGVDKPAVFVFGIAASGDIEGAGKIFTGFERSDGTNTILVSSTVVNDTDFHHYVYTRSGNMHSLYLDGEIEADGTFDGLPGSTSDIDLVIGALRDQSGGGAIAEFHGVIDEVKIYGRALSECEVQASFQAGAEANLVSWWSFDNVAGVNVPDLIDGNDGTLINGPVVMAGKVGQGMYFDGVDDEVRVAAADNLNITGDVTVELWAKKTSPIDSILETLIIKGGGTFDGADAPSSFIMVFTNEFTVNKSIKADFESDLLGDNNNRLYGSEIIDGDFHHYVYVRGGDQHMLYVDGSLDAVDTFLDPPGDTSDLDLTMGALNNQDPPGSLYHFNGIMDEVKIYDQALNLAEVKVLYDSGNIFNEDVSLDVPFFSQRDEEWGGEEYDYASSWTSPGKIGIERWGCALTSAAMVLGYHGVNQGASVDMDGSVDYFATDPGNLNEWLIGNNGYTNWGGVIWSSITKYAKVAKDKGAPGSGKTFEFYYPDYTGIDQISDDLESEDPVPGIIRLVKNSNGGTHFVVTTGVDGTDDILLNDPWQLPDEEPPHSLNGLYPENKYTRSKLGRFVPSETDMSYLWMFGEPGVELMVVDPVSEDAIPESFGFMESLLDSDDPDNSESPEQFVWGLPKPDAGSEYLVRVSLTSGEAGVKLLDLRLFDEDGNQVQLLLKVLVGEGDSKELLIKVGDNLDEIVVLHSFDSVMDDLQTAGDLGLIHPWGLLKSFQARLWAAERLAGMGRNGPAVKILENLVASIKQHTPDQVGEEVSELLVGEIGQLMESL